MEAQGPNRLGIVIVESEKVIVEKRALAVK